MKAIGLPYYGGKNPRRKVGPWIASMLPHDKKGTYVEAFAGMAGVMLCRPPCNREILNDADGHLVNWWLMVRDFPDELGELLENTPMSAELYYKYYEDLTKGAGYIADPMERAVAYTVCIEQGLAHGLGRRHWAPRGPTTAHKTGRKKIKALANRMREVIIEHCDAVRCVNKHKHREDTVLYLDPPYHSTKSNDIYKEQAVDVDALSKVAAECKGFVAISGYGKEWDHLGWERKELKAKAFVINPKTGGKTKDKIEVLWHNKPLPSDQKPEARLFDL